MKISLESVRQILREALGFDSFTASFIRSVEEDTKVPTAGIDKEGTLSYNPLFVKRNVTCQEDLFSLIFHELLHPMFNHFIHNNGPIENLAADAVINAVIGTIYPCQSRDGQLFRRIYTQKGVEGLLRPMSQMSNSRLERTYERLYQTGIRSDKLTTGELITTLKILLQPPQVATVVLLGSHPGDSNRGKQWPKETLEKIAGDIKRSAVNQIGNMAGYSENLIDMFMESLRTHLAIKRVILQKLTTNRKVDKFKELFRERRISTSPVPLYPSKRDLVLIANGLHPGFFHNQLSTPAQRQKGLAIYLDVSGSVNNYLPKILGILQHLRREITSVFLFSNKVYETPFTSLLKGKIKTTGGTDFDCIAGSVVEKQLDKVVIITDGYASMSETNKAKLRKQGLITLTVLFDRAQSCKDFANFGDVVHLADICN